MIELKSEEEIERMRRPSRIVGEKLVRLSEMVTPGVTTADLNDEAERMIEERGCRSAFKNYQVGDAVFPAVLCTSVNDEVVHGIPSDRALDDGDIDVYVDYSGTLWANEMARGHVQTSRGDVLNDVRQFLKTEHGISLAAVLGFENSYALAVLTQDARRLGLRTISDLKRYDANLTIGGDYEFFVRPEWAELQDKYKLLFAEQRTMDPTLMYQAVATGNVDVISAFSSDGRITSYGLEILEDDQDAIPPYDAIVLVGARLVEETPGIISVLSKLNNTIDVNRMRELNLQVDEQGNSPRTAALAYINRLRTTLTESR